MNIAGWQIVGKDPENRKKITVFILCLIFSFVSWLFIKLSRESAATFPVAIEISNIPDNVLFTSRSDTLMLVNIESTGINLLMSRLFRKPKPIETEFGALQRQTRNNKTYYYLTNTQASIRFALMNDLPRSALRIQPDTIFFATTEAFQKKVPVRLESQIEFLPGFNFYNSPVISPDSVLVSGPVEFKDSIEFIPTEVLNKKEVYQNISGNIKLKNPLLDQKISISHKEVEIFIPIEEYIEATVELPLNIDCRDIYENNTQPEILLFPNQVTVYYLVALKDDIDIHEDMFSAYVSCPDSHLTNSLRLKTEVREQPDWVEIIRIRPAEVEFIIIK